MQRCAAGWAAILSGLVACCGTGRAAAEGEQASALGSAPVQQPAAIGEPDWVQRPDADDYEHYYPQRAYRLEVRGEAVLDCVIAADGTLSCSVAWESPADQGFGAAALAISKLYRHRATTREGLTVAGRKVVLPIMFAPPPPPSADAPPSIIAPPPYDAAVISQSIFQRVPDPRPAQEAAAKRIGVRVTLNDADLLPSPTRTAQLARKCGVSRCVYYRRYCAKSGTYCGFSYGVAPQDALRISLKAFQVEAKTGALLDAALNQIAIPLGGDDGAVVHLSELAQMSTDPNGCADPAYVIFDKPSCPPDMARDATAHNDR